MTEQIDISEKPKTKLLQKLLEDLKESVINLEERILAVYNQARCEDYTPWEARDLIVNTIKISYRHLMRILPKEAKQENIKNEVGELEDVFKDSHLPDGKYQSLNTTSAYDYDPNTVTITTKHDVIDPYKESQDKLNDLIKETQNQQLKPISVESATERAKRLMQETGYDIDEEKEDIQIKLNDAETRIQTLEENEKRKTIALDKAHERNKEQQEEINRLKLELEKTTKTSPLDIPPQTPTVCNTEIKAKTKIQLYLSKEIITAFFKRQAVENARDIPNMTIYGEVTNYLQNDDLIIGKIGTIRSSI